MQPDLKPHAMKMVDRYIKSHPALDTGLSIAEKVVFEFATDDLIKDAELLAVVAEYAVAEKEDVGYMPSSQDLIERIKSWAKGKPITTTVVDLYFFSIYDDAETYATYAQ